MLIFIGEGVHGETHLEVLYSCLGLLLGTVFLAYFTSTMVTLVTLLNQVRAVVPWNARCLNRPTVSQ